MAETQSIQEYIDDYNHEHDQDVRSQLARDVLKEVESWCGLSGAGSIGDQTAAAIFDALVAMFRSQGIEIDD